MKIRDRMKALSIRQRFTLSILTSIIVIVLIYGSIWTFSTIRHNSSELAIKIDTTSQLAAMSLSDSLWNFDYDGIDAIIDGLFQDREIGLVEIDPLHENPLITRKKDGAVYNQMLTDGLPIYQDGEIIGRVTIGITPYYRTQALYNGFWSLTGGLLLMVGFIWLAITAVSKAVTKPIMDLTAGTEEIASGNLSKRLNADVGGEVGVLAAKFNAMAENLHLSMQERDRTLAALTVSEEKFNKAFKHVADAIGIINLHTQRYIEINDAFSTLLGYDQDTVIGHSSQEFGLWYSPVERDEVYRLLHSAGTFSNFETRWRAANGSILTGICSAEVIEISGEKCILFVWFDITERKLAEERLQQANDELEDKVEQRTSEYAALNQQLMATVNELQAAHRQIIQQEKMASIGQLAAGVAHEINNPLGFIISNIGTLNTYLEKNRSYISTLQGTLAELAQLRQDSADCESFASVIQKAERARLDYKIDYILDDITDLLSETAEGAHRVKNIVQDLKTFSRTVVEAAETDLNKGIQSVVNILWNEIKYKVTVKQELGELPLVWCNPNQIIQVIMNLVHNAAQSIEVSGEIHIRTWAENGFAYIRIADTGSGMTEAVMNRIFEPFFTTKEVGFGTGLGLSIAYEIVKNHGGSIDVTSTLGVGTAFEVKLPIAPPK